MADSEWFMLVAAAVFALFYWIRWLLGLFGPVTFGAGQGGRFLVLLVLVVCLGGILALLRAFAAGDVRDAPQYLAFYTVAGAAWLGLSTLGFSVLGLSARDDVAERRNPAAAIAVSGALAAGALAYAGGNFGDGPGWWVVVFSAGLGTLTLLGAWLVASAAGGLGHLITVERDRAAGWRAAGYLIGCGLVVCRAAAGNWISAERTTLDFVAIAWPIALAAAMETLLSQRLRPRPEQPARSPFAGGFVPGLLYVGAGAMYVWSRGWW